MLKKSSWESNKRN